MPSVTAADTVCPNLLDLMINRLLGKLAEVLALGLHLDHSDYIVTLPADSRFDVS
jgi:hypothetical protein